MERPGRGRLILASASPRRRELLAAAGVAFEVEASAADEGFDPAWTPEEVARRLAERKAEAVAAKHAGEHALVLAADTVVAVEVAGRPLLLEKPADAADARRMLGLLSATRHRVVTGVCARSCAPGGLFVSDRERTWVRMRRIEPAEIEAYVASGEWRDKAGGYAIQETADRFVVGLEEGGFDNVVGLPVALALRLVDELAARLRERA